MQGLQIEIPLGAKLVGEIRPANRHERLTPTRTAPVLPPR